AAGDVQPRQNFMEYISRWLFIAIRQIKRCALETFAALRIRLELYRARAARPPTLHPDGINQIRRASRRYNIRQCIFRNASLSKRARLTEKKFLEGLAYNFVRFPAAPGPYRSVEAVALPPFRVAARCMNRDLHCAGIKLTNLVAGHEKAPPGS